MAKGCGLCKIASGLPMKPLLRVLHPEMGIIFLIQSHPSGSRCSKGKEFEDDKMIFEKLT
jgi:hypothetical protein